MEVNIIESSEKAKERLKKIKDAGVPCPECGKVNFPITTYFENRGSAFHPKEVAVRDYSCECLCTYEAVHDC